jgi:hypothetical protein
MVVVVESTPYVQKTGRDAARAAGARQRRLFFVRAAVGPDNTPPGCRRFPFGHADEMLHDHDSTSPEACAWHSISVIHVMY